MIKVENLTKIYKLTKKKMAELKTTRNVKIAVDKISFEAHDGEIFGLLGPNGAGKTTTMRMMATLLLPTEGTITVQGNDVKKHPDKVRKCIGFLTNELKLDPHFSPKYTMEFFGKLYGLSDEQISARRDELFDKFAIKDFENKKIESLSTGMKQKLSIAVSLIHNPQVVIFDEPTNGLDIITARVVTDYLQELKKEGKLVIVSTHIMSLAEKLCDKVAIIIDGKLVANGTVKEIVSSKNSVDLEDAFFELYKENYKED
ncbi:MAG: transporter ATP-binding protein [Clostridiales bacterium]|jgi:sodium transport system ATP-binding protein|nr:transporter ATP-binding protein [Clostridiales bacterium]